MTQFDDQLKLLIEACNNSNRGLNNFGLIIKDGATHTFLRRPCFAALYSTGTFGKRGLSAFVDNCVGSDEHLFTAEESKELLDWLFEKSFFAPAFASPRSDFPEVKTISYNVNLPFQFLILAAKFVRVIRESANYPYIWKQLSKYVEEDLALILALSFVRVSDKYYRINYGTGNHVPFTIWNITLPTLKRILEKDHEKLNKQTPAYVSAMRFHDQLGILREGEELLNHTRPEFPMKQIEVKVFENIKRIDINNSFNNLEEDVDRFIKAWRLEKYKKDNANA